MNPRVLVASRVAVLAGIAWVAGGRERPAPEETPWVLRTSPTCDRIVGYSGPNDCEIRLDGSGRIGSVRLLHSGDTAEHADAVRGDAAFFARFAGLDPREPGAFAGLDGVSRATLTSLSVIESVAQRLSGSRPSLRFPEPVPLAKVRQYLAGAARLGAPEPSGWTPVLDGAGRRLGGVVRTGPGQEAVVGYQGPSDAVLVFGGDRRLLGLEILASYDNEKYVGYVRDDRGFAGQFAGATPETLAGMLRPGPDGRQVFPAHEVVDGVSGATMTSHAVAEGIARAAARLLRPAAGDDPGPARRLFRGRDLGTAVAVLLALLLTFSRLRGHRKLRLASRVAVVGYLGILGGDMLSQGLLAGWVENGLPLGTAPGLVLLAAVAFLVPVCTGQQTYCHQLCPFGAAQELVRRAPWRRALPAKAARVLRPLRFVLLAAVGSAVALGVGVPLQAIEPFGAWAWPLAGVATCALFVAALVASSFYPMVYCKVGCPTGALLDHVRCRRNDRLRRRDGVALLVLVGAVLAA